MTKEKIIIQVTLFGGEAFLHISELNKIIYNDIIDINIFKIFV